MIAKGREDYFYFYNMGLLETMEFVFHDNVTLRYRGDIMEAFDNVKHYSIFWFNVLGQGNLLNE